MTSPHTSPRTTTAGLHAAEIGALLAACRQAAERGERPDLLERLDAVAERIRSEQARTLVIGEYKAGKTELVNALLAAPVLPTDTHRATTVPTVVSDAESPRVRLVSADRTGDGSSGDGSTEIDPSELAAHVTEVGNAGNTQGWSHAEVGLPRKLLATGLVLVDTPGGLGAPASVSTMAELPNAAAVVLVSDAGRELTASELSLLRTAAGLCPAVFLVLTRIDLHTHWRRIAYLDRGHLDAAGLDGVPVLPVSASLRLHAAATEDAALDAETGMAELVGALTAGVAGEYGRRRARFVADELLAVSEQLALGVRTELRALADPAVAHRLKEEAQEARARVAALRDKASRWQQTLNDGVADLVSDIEYDLRDRLRAVSTDAEEALDETDPAKTWEQFAPWLHERVTEATSTNAIWAQERTRWLAERVGSLFAADGEGVLPPLDLGTETGLADPVNLMAAPAHEKFGLSQSLLVGMRGSYGGVLMIGMLTTVAGLALLNPFSLGAGVLLGSKTLVDERKRARRRRQGEAKQAVRRYVDDVIFRVGKNTRDMLRDVQRTLRDHFSATARELDRSLNASVAAANAALSAQSDETLRARRESEAKSELTRLEEVGRRSAVLRAAVAPEAAHAAVGAATVTALPPSPPSPPPGTEPDPATPAPVTVMSAAGMTGVAR